MLLARVALPLLAASSPRAGAPSCVATTMELYDPAARDAKYEGNVAQYLVDLHDSKSTFDFCGGMMFQLVLSDKLRGHLESVATSGGKQPTIFDAGKMRMGNLPDYAKTADADNVKIFHGREVRQVKDAAGGMGFVLHLSYAGEGDKEGWTKEEIAGYDGWGHDSGRIWRNGKMLEAEGFDTFKEKFGQAAYTLHHRFYLHFDRQNRMWLSAEDGCEGVAASAKQKFFGMF